MISLSIILVKSDAGSLLLAVLRASRILRIDVRAVNTPRHAPAVAMVAVALHARINVLVQAFGYSSRLVAAAEPAKAADLHSFDQLLTRTRPKIEIACLLGVEPTRCHVSGNVRRLEPCSDCLGPEQCRAVRGVQRVWRLRFSETAFLVLTHPSNEAEDRYRYCSCL